MNNIYISVVNSLVDEFDVCTENDAHRYRHGDLKYFKTPMNSHYTILLSTLIINNLNCLIRVFIFVSLGTTLLILI